MKPFLKHKTTAKLFIVSDVEPKICNSEKFVEDERTFLAGDEE